MSFFRRLFAGCWLRHEPVWEGDHFRCLTCGERIDVLPQAVILGPKHAPDPVRGQPKQWAVTEKAPAKVISAESRFQ